MQYNGSNYVVSDHLTNIGNFICQKNCLKFTKRLKMYCSKNKEYIMLVPNNIYVSEI